MSTMTKRYFWADAPSPAHDLIAQMGEHNKQAYTEAKASLDAITHLDCNPVYRGAHLCGFCATVDPLPAHLRADGEVDGKAVLVPYGRTILANALRHTIRKAKPRMDSREIARRLRLDWMCIDVPNLVSHHSACGWRDNRFWIQIPFGNADQNSGREGPDIPAWLTEAKAWEMDRWFAEGREAVEKMEHAA